MIGLNGGVGGGNLASRQNLQQNLSCMNNRSAIISDTSQDLSTYVSREKKQIGGQSQRQGGGFLSGLFSQHTGQKRTETEA